MNTLMYATEVCKCLIDKGHKAGTMFDGQTTQLSIKIGDNTFAITIENSALSIPVEKFAQSVERWIHNVN